MEIVKCLQCGNVVSGSDCGYTCMTCGYNETWSDITPRLSSIKTQGVSKQWVRRLNEQTTNRDNRRIPKKDTD